MKEGYGAGRIAFFDGLRALAVLAVMGYHSGLPGFRVGGFYGVDGFFVLSGLLITYLLLDESAAHGTIRLVGFWARRARRLFPALIVMLLALDVYVAFVAPAGQYPGFRADAVSVVGYFSNWHFISVGSNYFASTGTPSLLTHTWSLAIEEQFYLVWPLVVLVLVRWTRRRSASGASAVLVVSLGGALASAAWMAWRYRAGYSASRLYYGTDTHAQCLLVGAALAAGLHRFGRDRVAFGHSRQAGPSVRRRWGFAGALLAATGIGWMVTHTGSDSGFAYQGGFLLFAGLMALLLLSMIADPTGIIARLLSTPPLVYLGTISYGMYLWYLPLFEIITRARTGLTGEGLFAVRAAADIAVASVSFYAVERPIRTRRTFRIDPARHLSGLRPTALAAAGLVVTFAVVSMDTSGVLPVTPAAPPASAASIWAQSHPGLRVLVIGDSTALTLGLALANPTVADSYGIAVSDQATLGCGIAISAEVREHGQATSTSAACNPATPVSEQWPARLQAAVATFHPDVVLVVAGRWEVLDRRASAGTRWQDITEPGDAQYVKDQLGLAIQVGASTGATVVVATASCFSSGEQPSGASWPEDSPLRIAAYDRVARAAVASHSNHASLLDLGGIVCPDGTYHQTFDGVEVRAPDGIHFPFFSVSDPEAPSPDTLPETQAFGQWIAARIVPALVAAHRGSVGNGSG